MKSNDNPALAAEAVGPSDEDILRELADVADDVILSYHPGDVVDAGRRLLARYSAPRPIPVAERLPGAGDRDPAGQCWWFTPSEEKWIFWPLKWAGPECSHWLPFSALPLPTSAQEGADG